jgi:protein phosphatase
MSKQWAVGARSETGYVRNENQDRMSYVQAPFGDLYIVSDGMGGHQGGALAAELTIQALNQELSSMSRIFSSFDSDSDAIRRAFEEANRVVYDGGHSGNPDTQGMGATAVALLAAQFQIMVAHVGDSRAYLFTAKNKLSRLTKDHSRVQRMIDAGILSPAEAERHPDACILERAIGVSREVMVDISPWIQVNKGDRILLCSDGLHGYVSDTEIADILNDQGTVQELVDRLVQLALGKGGEDNVTIQLIECPGGNSVGWSNMGCYAVVIPGIIGLSLASAFVATEYWSGEQKGKLNILEQKNALREAEFMRRAEKFEQSLELLRTQIVQLNEKIDGKATLASQNSHQNLKSNQVPKSKKKKFEPPSEKHGSINSQATGRELCPNKTSQLSPTNTG